MQACNGAVTRYNVEDHGIPLLDSLRLNSDRITLRPSVGLLSFALFRDRCASAVVKFQSP